ncbi:MAG: glycosyltransferase [Bacteroidia bacterium]
MDKNNFPFQLSISLVIYNSSINSLLPLINSIKTITVPVKLVVSDNSEKDDLKDFFEKHNAHYIFNNANLGYGKAHNIAIKYGNKIAPYHLVINPDVSFNENCIELCLKYLETNKNIGLLIPKTFYPNGQTQIVCNLLPSPFDLILRRFVPSFFNHLFKKSADNYELKNKDLNLPMYVNNIHGCFLLMPHKVLEKVGLFDEKFFMYLEDTDLSRRISNEFDAIYYPYASIIHSFEKGSYKNKKLLVYHIQSAIYYFTKWGWFFDKNRNNKNNFVLNQLQTK